MKNIISAAACVAVATCALSLLAARDREVFPEPELRLPKMSAPPKIDGVVDEGEWAGAARMEKFCILRQTNAIDAGGSFWLGRDDDNIYIAVVSEIGPNGLVRNIKPTGRPNQLCFRDDCVELGFFQDWYAKKPTLAHFVVNFNGAWHVAGLRGGSATTWEGLGDFKSASTERGGSVHFEFSVPLKSVLFDGSGNVVRGIRIARNFKRIDTEFGYQTSWSPQDASFLTAANCPKVVFDDDAPVVQMLSLGERGDPALPVEAYPVAARVSNTTAKPMSLKISFAGRPVNSQPCVFSEEFALAPGESRDFKASGAVLGDEWIDFDFRVAAGSRTCCSRRLKFRCNAPPLGWIGGGDKAQGMKFDYAYYPSKNVMAVRIDVLRAGKRPASPVAAISIRNVDGLAVASTNVVFSGDVANVLWPIPDLEKVTIRTGQPKYAIEASVDGVDGGRASGTFYRDDLREWEGNKIGMSDTVVPPFTPLERVTERRADGSGEEHVRVVLRGHAIGEFGLWRQVTAAGRELLSAPMRLEGDFSAPRPETSSEWDYDGMMEWRLVLKPGSYRSLRLVIPVKDREARLMHSCVDGLRKNYAGAAPIGDGLVWDSTRQGGRNQIIGDYLPYLWVGGTLRGISVFGENDRGWSTGVRPCVEMFRRDGTLEIVLNIVSKPFETSEPRVVRLGFQATPVKPMGDGWRAKSRGRFFGSCYVWGGQGGCIQPFDETTEFWDKMAEARRTGKVDEAYLEDALKRFKYKGKPGSKERDAHEDKIRRHFRAGMNLSARDFKEHEKFVFYTNARGLEFGINASRTYCDEWYRWEFLGRPNRDFERNERRDYDLDPVPSYRDFAAWWYRKMCLSGACDALYWDDIYLSGNFSLPMCDAYRLPDGEIQPATGIFAMKALVRRCAVTQAEAGVEPMDNWIHMTNTAMAPISAFAGVHYDWEDTADLMAFQDRYGRDYLLASAIGRQMGCRVAVMGYISKTTPENLARLERTGVGVTLAHELEWPRVRQWRDAHKLLTDWGYRSPAVDVWNDWDEDLAYPLAVAGEPCVSLAMAKRAACEAAAVVCDWGEGGTVRLTPDCVALGIPANFEAVDMESGAKFAVSGGVAAIPLKKHDFAMVLFRAIASHPGF